jgi:hypothetical protein
VQVIENALALFLVTLPVVWRAAGGTDDYIVLICKRLAADRALDAGKVYHT